jgi:hypothetical protein
LGLLNSIDGKFLESSFSNEIQTFLKTKKKKKGITK